jgi:hypothetical protein
MNRTNSFIAACVIALTLYSCSKKTIPQPTHTGSMSTTTTTRKVDTVAAKKVLVKAKPVARSAAPKVVILQDKYAKRSVDGRLYYDLQGHRYWRSNKDGKYYLYNKSMHTDEAFKAPAKTQ